MPISGTGHQAWASLELKLSDLTSLYHPEFTTKVESVRIKRLVERLERS